MHADKTGNYLEKWSVDCASTLNFSSLICVHLRSSVAIFRLLFLCFLLFLSPVALLADEKTIKRDQVEPLIRGLDAATLIERSRAERQLMELGPDVLPLLPPPELIESLSTREAIRRIRPQLERRAARESSAASSVTFHDELPLHEILEQIQLQTKNRIKLVERSNAVGQKRLRVDWDNTHFWECLEDVCQRAGLQWLIAKEIPEIRIDNDFPALPKVSSVQYVGPFRVAVTTAEIRPVIGEEEQRMLRVNGRLSVEPRLRPLFLTMSASSFRATTNDDHSLPTWNPGAKYEIPLGDGGRDVPFQWDFRMPDSAHVKMMSIRGQIQCQIAAATERVVFDQTSQARGTIRRRGGVTVRIRHVNFDRLENERMNADIGITVSYDNGGPAFESHRSWIFHNAVYLENKDGTRTDFTDFETTQQADGAVAVDYRWQNVSTTANSYLFVYEAPTLIIDVPIEVDLAGVRVN